MSRLLLTLCSQMGYVETSTHLPSQEINVVVICSNSYSKCSDSCTHHAVRCLHRSCQLDTWMVMYDVRMVHVAARLDICLCFVLCPLLYWISPMYNLAMLSSACVLTHLLSSSCTSYFVPLHTYICAFCKCIRLVV